MKVFNKLCCSLLMCVIAYCLSLNIMGVVAVIIGLDSAKVINYCITVLFVVMSVIALYIYWSGRLNTSDIKGIKVCKLFVCIGFGGIILSSILYMLVLGEIKIVMLTLAIITWVLLFGFLHILNKIESKLVKEN